MDVRFLRMHDGMGEDALRSARQRCPHITRACNVPMMGIRDAVVIPAEIAKFKNPAIHNSLQSHRWPLYIAYTRHATIAGITRRSERCSYPMRR